MNMKQWIVAGGLGLALTASACSSDGGSDGGSQAASTAVFGVVSDVAGAPVAGATVRVGSASVVTDAQGRYAAPASAGEVVVRVVSTGYLDGVRGATVVDGHGSALDFVLLERADAVAVDASVGGTVDGARGAQVIVPAGALVDPDGAPVTGMVDVYLTPIDPGIETELLASPGDFEARTTAGSTVQIETFGMVDVTILDADGRELDVADGATLTVAIPAPTGATELPASVPSWSFDEDAGIWRQEGTLTLDPAAGTWVGDIPHLSFWNADREMETTCIVGIVVDGDTGEPLPGARVSARGVDYFGVEMAHAGADGRFVALARTSSRVVVTASHDAGGGAQREVSTGAAVVSRPVTPDTAGCVDLGEVPVRRGTFELADGTRVTCDPAALADFRACSDVLVTIATCHSPAGACTQAGGLFALGYEYENGARLETSFDETGTVTSTFFGPGGVPCGSQQVQGSGIMATDAAGRTEQIGVQVGSDGGVTYTCPGGGTYSLSAAEQERLAACSGGGDTESCGEADMGNMGELCADDGECTGPTRCCFGVCMTEDICSIGPDLCESDAECESGQICCGDSSQCVAPADCYGACTVDADCAADGFEGPCCDGECVFTQACAGECDGDADCGADYPYCCPPYDPATGGTFCAADAQSCYAWRGCGADSECGADSGLVCCPGEDGADDVCRTASECWGGRSCTVDSDCGGGLSCCDRSDLGAEPTCQTELECNSFRPCEADADCFEGLTCCASFENLCVPPEICF